LTDLAVEKQEYTLMSRVDDQSARGEVGRHAAAPDTVVVVGQEREIVLPQRLARSMP
jgi:hypothetical protein